MPLWDLNTKTAVNVNTFIDFLNNVLSIGIEQIYLGNDDFEKRLRKVNAKLDTEYSVDDFKSQTKRIRA